MLSVIELCKSLNIPTVFWNKEDPIEFKGFIHMAKLFDIVYTTDIGCIPKYKKELKHNRVYLLPFAAQPTIHNPLEIYDKREDKISFAGTYYTKRFEQRKSDFEFIANVAMEYGLDIYDRHYNENNPYVKYPEKYKNNICGTLNGDEIVKAYKGYKFSMNVNTVKKSFTMFARRVFELIASNTIVISSLSRGIEEFFGDLVICEENESKLKEKIDILMSDKLTYKKYRLLALRQVLKYHTYKDRFEDIKRKALNIADYCKWDDVAVIAFADDYNSIYSIRKNFNQQNYKNRKLYIFCRFDNEEEHNLYNINTIKDRTVDELIKEKYISLFHKDDYYGTNYLTDLMCGTIYAPHCDAIGKSSYFSKESGLILNVNKGEYRLVNELMYRNSIIKTIKICYYPVNHIYKIIYNESIKEENMVSIDCFNYIYNGQLNITDKDIELVSDIDNINVGKDIESILSILEK